MLSDGHRLLRTSYSLSDLQVMPDSGCRGATAITPLRAIVTVMPSPAMTEYAGVDLSKISTTSIGACLQDCSAVSCPLFASVTSELLQIGAPCCSKSRNAWTSSGSSASHASFRLCVRSLRLRSSLRRCVLLDKLGYSDVSFSVCLLCPCYTAYLRNSLTHS